MRHYGQVFDDFCLLEEAPENMQEGNEGPKKKAPSHENQVGPTC